MLKHFKDKPIRSIVVLWVLGLITYATIQVFGHEVELQGEYLALLGLLSIAIAFFKTWSKSNVDEDNDIDRPYS